MTRRVSPRELARLLRQAEELGARSWTFERLGRDAALELVRRAAADAPSDRTGLRAPGTTEAVAETVAKTVPETVPHASTSDASAPGASDFEPPTDYDALREAALVCTRCRLAGERTQVVFSDGSPQARVMVVGEAPGADEDRTGVPFVGRAGRLLDLLLASVGLSRQDSVYICNVLKCRPPGNRNPQTDEIETCAPWLRRQIDLVSPEVILAVGTFAGQLLSGRNMALGRLRGQVYSYQGTPLVVTYHPAALLRNPGWTRATWDDLQLLRQVLDGA